MSNGAVRRGSVKANRMGAVIVYTGVCMGFEKDIVVKLNVWQRWDRKEAQQMR